MARAWFFLVLLNSSSFRPHACRSPASPVRARAGRGGPCSPPAPGFPLPPPGLPAAPPSLLQTAPLLVQIMNGAPTLTKLIKQILDLISEVLVLALDNIQLLNSLILGSLQPEQLRRVVSALVLGGGHLGRDIGGLGLPLAQNLVKVLAPLLSDESSGMHPLVLHGEVIKLRVHPALGLLGISHLGGQAVNKLLALNNLGLQLVASSLKLLNAAHSLGLIAGLPQLDLSLGLGVLQLGGDRDLALVHVSNGSL